MKFVRFHRIAALPLAITALLLLGAFIVPALSKPSSTDPATEITQLIQDQAAAWNRGDIDGFMAGYESSDTLRFASGGNITRGWKPTLDRYKTRYPDRAAMGTLIFSDLEITILAKDAAVVFGRWKLERANDKPDGLFTLTFRKGDSGWRIIHDHTSSATP